MKLSPFNIIYNGIDLESLSDEIKQLVEKYNIYYGLTDKITTDKITTLAYPVDVDDDNFTLHNAFGKEISKIYSYSTDKKTFTDEEITFPVSKDAYSNIYSSYTVAVTIDRNTPYAFSVFNNNSKYRAMDFKYKKRLEYVLNIVCGAHYAPHDGSVDSINDGYVTIKNDDETTDVPVNNNYLIIEEGQELKRGDLLEKFVSVNGNNKLIVELINQDINKQTIEFLTRLNTYIIVK